MQFYIQRKLRCERILIKRFVPDTTSRIGRARPIITRNHLASKSSKDFNENRLCIHNVLYLGFNRSVRKRIKNLTSWKMWDLNPQLIAYEAIALTYWTNLPLWQYSQHYFCHTPITAFSISGAFYFLSARVPSHGLIFAIHEWQTALAGFEQVNAGIKVLYLTAEGL